jgi:hypothetical protein
VWLPAHTDPRERPQIPVCEPQTWSGIFGGEKNILLLSDFELWIFMYINSEYRSVKF